MKQLVKFLEVIKGIDFFNGYISETSYHNGKPITQTVIGFIFYFLI